MYARLGITCQPKPFQLLTRSPFLSIVLLTARDDLDTHLTAMRLGVSEFIVKPARIQDLVARLQVHLECSRKAREMERVLTDGVLEGATPCQYSPVAEEG